MVRVKEFEMFDSEPDQSPQKEEEPRVIELESAIHKSIRLSEAGETLPEFKNTKNSPAKNEQNCTSCARIQEISKSI